MIRATQWHCNMARAWQGIAICVIWICCHADYYSMTLTWCWLYLKFACPLPNVRVMPLLLSFCFPVLLPRMKDGRRPLLPMHGDACAVSESEPNQGEGKVSKHGHDIWRRSGNKSWKRRQSSRTLPPYYGYCDNIEVMFASRGSKDLRAKSVVSLPLSLGTKFQLFVLAMSLNNLCSKRAIFFFLRLYSGTPYSLWRCCAISANSLNNLSVWLAGYLIVSCLSVRNSGCTFLVSAMSLNNLSGNLVTSETRSACCWYSSLWAIKCYWYVSCFLRSCRDLIGLLYYYYLNKLNCFIIYYLRERGGH